MGNNWVREEDDVIIDGMIEDLSNDEIAIRLTETFGTEYREYHQDKVRGRTATLRKQNYRDIHSIKRSTKRRKAGEVRKWTEEEIELLKELRNEGFTSPQICKVFNETFTDTRWTPKMIENYLANNNISKNTHQASKADTWYEDNKSRIPEHIEFVRFNNIRNIDFKCIECGHEFHRPNAMTESPCPACKYPVSNYVYLYDFPEWIKVGLAVNPKNRPTGTWENYELVKTWKFPDRPSAQEFEKHTLTHWRGKAQASVPEIFDGYTECLQKEFKEEIIKWIDKEYESRIN